MQTDIFIAGAGLSGLALAAALKQTNTAFLLADSRDRVGGRILSLDISHDNQAVTVADMGPSWIWPGQPRIAALLERLGIETFEQYSSGLLVYEDEYGQIRRDLDYSTMAGSLRVKDGLGRLTRELAAQLPDQSILLSHRISCVRRQPQGYAIDLEYPGRKMTVQASKVVFAVPPRVIAAHIEFVPPLPDQVMHDLAATPTWMAGHAKFFALYERPFWRDAGLSGDGISRRGPLLEIHDASAAGSDYGALFGFVGIPANSPARGRVRLLDDATKQLERMFGPALANPLDAIVKDWAEDSATATPADNATISHPHYGMPASIAAVAEQGLLFASTEMARQFGGFIEGAPEASETALQQLNLKEVG